VHAACQDAEVQRWTEVPVPYLPAHAAEFVGPLTAAGWAEGGALFAADKLADGGVRRVELIAHPANTGSCRVAESAGFRAEGVLRSRYLHRGVPCDVVLYSLLTTDPRPPV
jgi:RimJ/RimL family protein N-acetyltransferase